MQQDGYYYVNSLCVTIGAVLLFTYIVPTIRYLESKFHVVYFFSRTFWRLNSFIDADKLDPFFFINILSSSYFN